MAATFRKDPDSILDFAIDWTAWLDDGDSIATATWTVAEGITQTVTPAATTTGAKTTIWLSGGTAGQTYPVTCRVTTTEGRVDERTIGIQVAQR